MKIRKKYFCTLFVALFLLIPASIVGSINQSLSFENEKKIKTNIPIESNDSKLRYTTSYPQYPTMKPTPINFTNNEVKPSVESTPSQFNWKEYNGDWTTQARNQEGCGSCWAFASVGILESIINIKENNPDLDPDLSEQYILSCLSGAGSCRGGSPNKALDLIMKTTPEGNNCNGVPFETCMPYQANDDIPCDEKTPDWQEKLVPISNYNFWNSDGSAVDRQRIKTQILENGPILTGIYADDAFKSWGVFHHNSSEYYPYKSHTIWSNHVIIIVGWHDDPSIQRGGYWICKNSWGQYWGNDGYFNIEYGSQGVDYGYIISVDYNPETVNWPPVGKIDGKNYGKINENLQFVATKSFDVEGPILSYHWDFGDGTEGTGVNVQHSYDKKGIYRLILTVTDDSGNTASTEKAVIIHPWTENDQWTYQFTDISCSFSQEMINVDVQANIPELTFTISKETETAYEMSFEGNFKADIRINFFNDEQTIDFQKSRLSGTIVFSKQHLGIQEVESKIMGRLRFNDIFAIPISFPFTSIQQFSFAPEFNYMNHPIYDDKKYDIECCDVSIQGSVQSRLLNIINFANTIAGFFGNSFIPEDIAQLLPNIRFEEVISLIGLNNPIRMPYMADLSVNEEMIQVPAGLFPSFSITQENIGKISYSQTVENLVKINIKSPTLDFNDISGSFTIQGELISTNYN